MNCLLYLIIFFIPFTSFSALIAHRGVHQTYPRDGLDKETCTANRIENTGHEFIEDTLASIEEAFFYSADIVEVDIHPTTELAGQPDKIAIFHDWTLDCKTNASCDHGCNCNDKRKCITNEQNLSYLKSLDIGYGYTYNKGKSYPFRGRFFGAMPSFEEVLNLLDKYPEKEILVDVKGNTKRSVDAFIRIISQYPLSTRERLYYPYKYGRSKELKSLGVKDTIAQSDKECFFSYLKVGWLGYFPKECRNKKIMVPIRETLERVIGRPGRAIKFTSVLWGWPKRFITLAHKYGTMVYASQVDSVDEFMQMNELDLDGIMTNKIEVIGPYSR